MYFLTKYKFFVTSVAIYLYIFRSFKYFSAKYQFFCHFTCDLLNFLCKISIKINKNINKNLWQLTCVMWSPHYALASHHFLCMFKSLHLSMPAPQQQITFVCTMIALQWFSVFTIQWKVGALVTCKTLLSCRRCHLCTHTFVHNKKVYSEYPQLGLRNGSKQNIVSLLFQHHFNTFIDYDSESLWTNNAVTWSNFLCLATAFFFLLSLSFSFFPWAV